MKHRNIIHAMEKQGWIVKRDLHAPSWFYCDNGTKTCSWYKRSDEDEAKCLHVKWSACKEDLRSDYSPGSFFETIKGAVEYMEGTK